MDVAQEYPRTELSRPARTNRWAFWGIGAGVLGVVANMVADPIVSLTTAQKQQGPAVLGLVHRALFQIGAVTGFLYRRLAGIAAAAPGFDMVEIRPLDDPRIDHGGGRYLSAKGPISTAWRRDAEGRFSLDLTLPPNVTGQVRLPARSGQGLFGAGRPFEGAFVHDGGHLNAEIGSGVYQFEVR